MTNYPPDGDPVVVKLRLMVASGGSAVGALLVDNVIGAKGDPESVSHTGPRLTLTTDGSLDDPADNVRLEWATLVGGDPDLTEHLDAAVDYDTWYLLMLTFHQSAETFDALLAKADLSVAAFNLSAVDGPAGFQYLNTQLSFAGDGSTTTYDDLGVQCGETAPSLWPPALVLVEGDNVAAPANAPGIAAPYHERWWIFKSTDGTDVELTGATVQTDLATVPCSTIKVWSGTADAPTLVASATSGTTAAGRSHVEDFQELAADVDTTVDLDNDHGAGADEEYIYGEVTDLGTGEYGLRAPSTTDYCLCETHLYDEVSADYTDKQMPAGSSSVRLVIARSTDDEPSSVTDADGNDPVEPLDFNTEGHSSVGWRLLVDHVEGTPRLRLVDEADATQAEATGVPFGTYVATLTWSGGDGGSCTLRVVDDSAAVVLEQAFAVVGVPIGFVQCYGGYWSDGVEALRVELDDCSLAEPPAGYTEPNLTFTAAPGVTYRVEYGLCDADAPVTDLDVVADFVGDNALANPVLDFVIGYNRSKSLLPMSPVNRMVPQDDFTWVDLEDPVTQLQVDEGRVALVDPGDVDPKYLDPDAALALQIAKEKQAEQEGGQA